MNLNGYELSRAWFDYCFNNPEKVKPNHTALYFFCVEHCNRLGWKEKFGLPTTMAKEAIGIRSYNTYINTLNDIVDFGFLKMIERSKNQYSSNIVALSNFNKALDKALDKATIKHVTKQSESTVQSIDSIIKQLTDNKEQITKEQYIKLTSTFEYLKTKHKIEKPKKEIPTFEEFFSYVLENDKTVNKDSANLKYKSWVENGWKDGNDRAIKNWKSKILNTIQYLQKDTQPVQQQKHQLSPQEWEKFNGQNKTRADMGKTLLTVEQFLEMGK